MSQQDEYTLIANSGIQMFALKLSINLQDRFGLWFHEWYDTDEGQWKLDLLHEIETEEDGKLLYEKRKLYEGGFLADTEAMTKDELADEGIRPLVVDEDARNDNDVVYKMMFTSKEFSVFERMEDAWLPLPYFRKKTSRKFDSAPFNWARIRLKREKSDKQEVCYTILMAFDTRSKYEADKYKENPVFPDMYAEEMEFALCDNEMQLMDFCAEKEAGYIEERLRRLAWPNIESISKIKGRNERKMGYIAAYVFLMDYLAQRKLLPSVRLFKDEGVPCKDIDMVVDIGNSRTTALLVEDSHDFNQIRPLELVDYTNPVHYDEAGSPRLRVYSEPFDMRLVFRKADFGSFGLSDSRQFVYPSLVRLGLEANYLMHKITGMYEGRESMSTYSSPKRFLWDGKKSTEEWRFLVLPGEVDDHVLSLKGITDQLDSTGNLSVDRSGGVSHHYSRRTLMTFSFLEMLVQARVQVNSDTYRRDRGDLGKPRRIKRIIITCPTAMSKKERDALHGCARDAVQLLSGFESDGHEAGKKPVLVIEVVPGENSEGGKEWYYDEATCAQLVYMYGEIGYKYKGCCQEFFDLYGQKGEDGKQALTVGTLDIGAGTTDLMISRYTYRDDGLVVLAPEPMFYDSFYFAGDDMLKEMILKLMLLDEENSAFRKKMKALSSQAYRQQMKDFFGPNHNGQTALERRLRGEFNLQYSIPLMCHFLELLKNGVRNHVVRFSDVFADTPPNPQVMEEFRKKFGIDIAALDWEFDSQRVSDVIRESMEPLLKQIATIMFAKACDIVLLSGRPASLPPIRDVLLKYYPVSPNRLILLNGYYVGEWYPFGNNTGCILNPKTVVAMGGVIGYYASAFSNLDTFSLDLGKLGNGLDSTVRFVKKTQEMQLDAYILTPEKNRGELKVNKLPEYLTVKQIGKDFYQGRVLYTIDFDEAKMAARISRGLELESSDGKVLAAVKERVEKLRKKMPFTVTLFREPMQWEDVFVERVVDKDGDEIPENEIDINIQSLGVEGRYWLDSGVFEF